jgi:hypothetical protein
MRILRILRISDLKSWIWENDLWIVIFLAFIAWCIYMWAQAGRDPLELSIIVIGVIFGLLYFTSDIYKLITRDAGALVCSLGDNATLVETVEGDADAYRGHFPAVEVCEASKLADLLATVSTGNFRILHILVEFADDGRLVEAQGTRADVASLFELCRRKKFLLIYFGGEIPEEKRAAVLERIAAARVGHDLPLVMTTERGAEFYPFLDGLLCEIGRGKMLGKAWLKLRPQDAGPGASQPAVDPGPKAVLLL